MTKPVLGTKRLCAGCNAKFYDLLKSPIVCPMCEAVFVVPKAVPPRSRRGAEAIPAAAIPVVAAPAIAAKNDDASSGDDASTGDDADGEKEAEAGVPLLEIDEED